MKRTLKYALSAVLLGAMTLPVFAQDNFPDVPDNHWAFEALQRMKREGLLVGYPDGLFRGSRPASRYELAVAVHATYVNLKNLIDGMQGQIEQIKANMPGGNTGGPSQADLDAVKQALTALQNDVNNLRSQDIADLKRMADTFEKELSSLGVDVQSMKKDLSDLQDRVSALEKRKMPVDISGDVNWVGLAGYSKDNNFGLTVDGRLTGVSRDGTFTPIGGNHDLSIWHEAGLTLTSTNDTGPKWNGTFVFGNMLGAPMPAQAPGPGTAGAFGNQSGLLVGSAFSDAGNEDIYVQNLSVMFDTSVYGLNFNANVGRVGYKINPYLFMRPDVTPYFANDRWDNGEWNFDGAILGFNFGKAKLDIFGGRNSNRNSVNGIGVQTMTAGTGSSAFLNGGGGGFGGRPVGFSNVNNFLLIDQSLGANLSLPLTSRGSLDLAYLRLDSNITTPSAQIGASNGVTVWGGSVKFRFGSIGLDGGYGQSDTRLNDHTTNTKNDKAWWANLDWNSHKWGAKVGYESIDPLYGAPGDWGRIGIWWNPTDIQGVKGDIWYDLSRDLRLTANGGAYQGRDTGLAGALTKDDKVSNWQVGLSYKMATNYNLALGYEEVRWDLTGATSGGKGDPIERWYDVGFGWSLSDRAKMSFMWQVSDYKAIGTPTFFVPGPAGSVAKGGLITTQLTVKF
jgi:hypothetical protein